jgi:hypothetical protein
MGAPALFSKVTGELMLPYSEDTDNIISGKTE